MSQKSHRRPVFVGHIARTQAHRAVGAQVGGGESQTVSLWDGGGQRRLSKGEIKCSIGYQDKLLLIVWHTFTKMETTTLTSGSSWLDQLGANSLWNALTNATSLPSGSGLSDGPTTSGEPHSSLSRVTFDKERSIDGLQQDAQVVHHHHIGHQRHHKYQQQQLEDGDFIRTLFQYVNLNLVRKMIAQNMTELIIVGVIIIYLVYYFSQVSRVSKNEERLAKLA